MQKSGFAVQGRRNALSSRLRTGSESYHITKWLKTLMLETTREIRSAGFRKTRKSFGRTVSTIVT